MSYLAQSYAKWRQWKLARVFRIEDAPLGAAAFLAVVADPATDQPTHAPPAEPATAGPDATGPVAAPTGPELLLAACNAWFRLSANLQQLEIQGDDSRPLRNMRRALNAMAESFEAERVECLDLSGQVFDPRRDDIEMIGQPEERPDLDRMIIQRCERPAVVHAGQLLQRARGIVAKPTAHENSCYPTT